MLDKHGLLKTSYTIFLKNRKAKKLIRMTVTENSNPATGVAHHLPLRDVQETKQVAKRDTEAAFQFSVKFKHYLF